MLAFAPTVSSAGIVKEIQHRGVHLSAMALPENTDGIVLLDPANGIENLRRAFDRIYQSSPFSVKHLDTLKRNGKVTVVYDASFRAKEMSAVTIAAYFPDFFQKGKGGLKQFLVVVGRFGVKWPTDKLAAVIVHELVGHGLQHFRGYRDKDRRIDLECEALIYELKSHQDLGIKRDTEDMVRLRREIRNNWCADFGRFLRDKGINADQAWGFGTPDVPKLLRHFDDYRKHLRRSGVSGKAVTKTKKVLALSFDAFAAEAERTGSAKSLLAVGHRYLKGVGVKRNAKKAAKWVRKSAAIGHGPAQHLLGALLAAGHGVKKDPVEAAKWFILAAANGIKASRKRMAKLSKQLSASQLKEAKRRAASGP